MVEVRGNIKIERISGTKYVRLLEGFYFYSDILGRWCRIPVGFVYDEESVPLLEGSNPEAGAGHDYLCRYDSDPVVDSLTAARVYSELQAYYDSKETGFFNGLFDWFKRIFKTDVVIIATPTYFHKLPVMATYEEVSA